MVAELSRSFAHQTALSKILLSFMKKKTHCNHNNGFFYIHSECIWSKLLKTVTVLIISIFVASGSNGTASKKLEFNSA